MKNMEYTIEQFEIDFENSYTVESKREVLEKALDAFDFSDANIKETILKYKDDLKDLQTEMKVEEDLKCKSDIENGVAELYTCIKDYDGLGLTLISGTNYYINYDDVKSKYVPKGSEEDIPDFVKEYVSNIKPLISIYLDNGIGTLKFRSLFLEDDFENYFTKVDLTQVV
jgi:hypothetical protein